MRSLLGDFRFGLGLAWNLRMLVLANVDCLVKGLKLLRVESLKWLVL